MRGVRVTLSIAILLCAAPVDAGAAKPDFIKAVVARTPFSPMPGVPPATPADILLDGLNGSVLEHYPAISLVEVHEDHAATLKQRGDAANVEVLLREHFDWIHINGRILDARDGSGAIPPGEVADAAYADGVEGMWLLQFMGPIPAAWLAAVEAEGVVLVQYVSYHTYIAAATNEEMQRAAALRFVQWTMQMHRFLKPALAPHATERHFAGRVFIADGEQSAEAVAHLQSLSRVPIEIFRFSNAELQIFGVFRTDDFDAILSQPLVWGIVGGFHDGDVADVPTLSFVTLVLLAAALAVLAMMRTA